MSERGRNKTGTLYPLYGHEYDINTIIESVQLSKRKFRIPSNARDIELLRTKLTLEKAVIVDE